MRRLRVWLMRLGGLFTKKSGESELTAELESHLQLHVEDNLRRGMSLEEARRDAVIKLGGVEPTKESYRERRGVPWMDHVFQDLRYALRMLRNSPGVSSIIALTLALAMGATTAIFSVVYGVLLRPLPYPQADRIVVLWELNSEGRRMNFADPNFDDLREQNRSLATLAAYSGVVTASVSGGAESTRTGLVWVTRDFFLTLRVQPVMGRGFVAEEQRQGAPCAAMVSYDYWRQVLGGDRDLSQRGLKTGKEVCAVVGVLPAGFRYPGGADIWLPREREPKYPSRTAHNWRAIGRLREGVTLGQARADLRAIAQRISKENGGGSEFFLQDAVVVSLQEALTGRARAPLYLLLGAAGFLLLVACANVANLLLAKATVRHRELGIRAALGATRGRLIGQFFTESLLLSLLGGVLGVLAARWGVDALLAVAPRDIPRLDAVGVDWPVLLFTFGLCVLVAIGLGFLTALRATSGHLGTVLVAENRGRVGTLTDHRLGRAIVAAQLGVTLVLLVGAGLLGRSLLSVLSENPGFGIDRIVAMDLSMPVAEGATAKARQAAFQDSVLVTLRSIPGVEEVGAANGIPLDRGLANGTFILMNPQETPKQPSDLERSFEGTGQTGSADYCAASEGYFRALGIPLLRGRIFDERDGMDAPHVALISDSLARLKWPKEDPLGHTIEFGNMDGDLRLLTVIGVVGDIREDNLETPPRPTIYVNLRQRPHADFTVVIRSSGDPAGVVLTARDAVRRLAPDAPPRFRTFSQLYAASLGSRRFNLLLLGVLAAAALLLAVAGIYGVMAYSVTQRTREIGVRMALGARGADVLVLVLRQGMQTAAVGLVLGIVGSFALMRTIESLLYGVRPADPVTFVAVVLLLAMVALLACYLPARRAASMDPMTALRYE
jgi:putative ABC transport system permease protein